MKIKRLKLDRFGCLNGVYTFAPRGCNLVLEPNEAGKTTLVNAILAAFYGFLPPGTERAGRYPTAEMYEPWDGDDRFRVETDIEAGDASYSVIRDFGADRVKVLSGDGEDVTERFTDAEERLVLLERLLGLGRDDFTKTAFVFQDESHAITGTRSLTHRLQSMADTESGGTTAGQALAILHEARDEYEGRLGGKGVAAELEELTHACAETEVSIERLRAERAAVTRRFTAFQDSHSDEKELSERMETLEFQLLRAEHEELSHELATLRRKQRELAAYRDELEQLEDSAAFSATDLGRLMQMADDRVKAERNLAELRSSYETDVRGPTRLVVEELKPLQHLKPLTREDLILLQGMAVHMRQARQEIDQLQRQLDQEESRLREQGRDLSQVDRLAVQMAELAEDQRELLGRYRERSQGVQSRSDALERDIGREKSRLEEMRSSRFGLRRWSYALLGFGVTAGTPGAFFTFAQGDALGQSIGAVLLGAGTLALLLGAALLFTSLRPNPKTSAIEARIAEMERDRDQLDEARRHDERRLAEIGEQLGAASIDAVLDSYRAYTEMSREVSELGRLRSAKASVERNLTQLGNEVASVIERCPGEPLMEEVDLSVVLRFAADLEKYHNLNDRLRLLQDMGARLTAETQRIESQLDEAGRAIAEIYARAGIAADTPLEETIARFREQIPRRERYDLLRNERIPRLEDEGVDEARIASLERKREILDKRIADRVRQSPELETVTVDGPSRELAERWREVSEESKRLSQQRFELRGELADTLSRYRQEVPRLRERLHWMQIERRRLDEFQRAVETAGEVLAELSRDTYRLWADGLNVIASEIVEHFNPDYRDIRFREDLTFTVESARTGRRYDQREVAELLSTGARDQIHLAIRMAVSQYLSGDGVRLPLILDDPFVSYDDQRFDQAMRFVVTELSRQHQVILLSCHEQRHRLWGERNPELFADGVHVTRPLREGALG